ncbi:MAG: helix-turn-helix transcriptional regulator [Actinobacteria bacterium]|nr:helix-turn-helix transcriptional regulator [Actinomycetota bacterium]MBO0836597.1 helix-turn-helix transcriptional regulator [Actinomycetota bacterium]
MALAVQRYRAEHGLTQRQLGKLLGMPQSNVARLEGGQRQPTIETLAKLARVLASTSQWRSRPTGFTSLPPPRVVDVRNPPDWRHALA